MKTSELTGALLDYWVAKAEGKNHLCVAYEIHGHMGSYSPRSNWEDGGPIIEREMITVTPQAYDVGPATCSGWVAVDVPYGIFEDDKGRRSANRFFSKSYLEAAMLCYVTRKSGDEVEDLPIKGQS